MVSKALLYSSSHERFWQQTQFLSGKKNIWTWNCRKTSSVDFHMTFRRISASVLILTRITFILIKRGIALHLLLSDRLTEYNKQSFSFIPSKKLGKRGLQRLIMTVTVMQCKYSSMHVYTPGCTCLCINWKHSVPRALLKFTAHTFPGFISLGPVVQQQASVFILIWHPQGQKNMRMFF